METAKDSIQRRRQKSVIRKGLTEVVPTSIQKSYFMLSDAERDVLNTPSGDDYSRVERLDERRFRLADVARHEKASFIYEYDFGDGWTHEVVVEQILPADPKPIFFSCLMQEAASILNLQPFLISFVAIHFRLLY